MKESKKILLFTADLADIVDAREVLRVSEEEGLDEVILLGEVVKVGDLFDRYYFQSSNEIINFYRGEYT